MIELSSIYLSRGAKPVFANLNLRIPRASYTVITGPSRAGKTSLVKLIVGLQAPDEGAVIVDGIDVLAARRSRHRLQKLRRLIGGVGGIYTLLSDRTILANVALSAEIAGTPARQARRQALSACSAYKLSHLASHMPTTISEAERRATLLARAEAARKQIVIADTPTDGLDDRSRRFIHEKLAALHLAGSTILYLSAGDVPKTGPDAIYRLEHGQIIPAGRDV